jgi:hypothetical protein
MVSKKAEAFDLGSIDTIEACNKAAEIEIKHPVTGAPTGVFISVLGKDSDAYRSIVRGMADETLKRQAMGKNDSATLEKLEQKNIEALVAVTTGWRTGDEAFVVVKGEQLPFTSANARRVYSELLPVRDQVAEAINNLENFMRG